jgi:hypothetical protein
VAALGAPQGADAGDPGLVLGDFGIKWVMLPGPVDQALAQRLDASVGLVPVSKAPAYDLWQVSGPVARARVVAKDGTVTPLVAQPVGITAVSAPAAGGTLVLAEPYGGWTATLGGTALRPLPAPVNGWAQGFTLPAGGGQLVITRNDLARDVSLIAELVAVLAICVLALPGKRADPAEEAAALAALRDAQHGRRAASAARGSRLAGRQGLPVLPGRAGLSRLSGRLEQSGREAARTGRAAAGGLGAFRGRATAQDTDPADLVTTGSGVGVLDDADADEPDYTEERDQAGQRDPWETGPHPRMSPTGPQQATPRGTGPHPRMSPTGPQDAAPWETGPHPRVSPTGPQQAAPWETGPYPRVSPTGPQPATGLWDTGGAGQPPDGGEGPGRDETAGWDEEPGWDETPEWRDDPPRRDEPARPAERHSHRARRHGRPGRQGRRWGAGNQRGSDGGS